ncbi:MAG: hypothetical protein ABI852_00585 [Gemmatimonadaceae bacterium]
MYSTCLFCSASLGANETIEHFPVGRRLAYDSATGRLWVVCKQCDRWNLSPLESRWEAIEEAERQFRATKTRVATDNIGLAKLSDGTELVRIGKPPELELAVWRYGEQFRKRHRKVLRQSFVATGAFAIPYSLLMTFPAVSSGLPLYAGVVSASAGPYLQSLISRRYDKWRNRTIPVANVRDEKNNLLRLTQNNVNAATLVAADGAELSVTVPHVSVRPAAGMARLLRNKQEMEGENESVLLRGDIALQALAAMLPSANRFGSTNKGVEAAMKVVQDSDNLSTLLRRTSNESVYQANRFAKKIPGNLIAYAPQDVRLALEMSLHADDERRAMEGELQQLEQRWRDADAIAKISDEMFLPDSVEAQLREWRGDS